MLLARLVVPVPGAGRACLAGLGLERPLSLALSNWSQLSGSHSRARAERQGSCGLRRDHHHFVHVKGVQAGQVCQLRTIVTMAGQKPNVVFVLGGPGAGKGTQCQKIVETFGYQHLSAGDLLREERSKPDSQFGELIENHITNGTIVPVEITCSLLERAMVNSKSINFLIDGFPRNYDNLEGWSKTMDDKVNFKFVIFFNCDEDTCVQRCLARGAAGSGRTDDNEESLKKRCNTYVKATMPIINHFKEKDMVREIDATLSADEVFELVKKLFA